MQFGSPPNHYTQRWFSTFLGRVDSSIVANEMSFLESIIPRATFRLVLDVCCGVGRHALPLSTAGYSVVAIDLSESALAVLGRAERDGNGPGRLGTGPITQASPAMPAVAWPGNRRRGLGTTGDVNGRREG